MKQSTIAPAGDGLFTVKDIGRGEKMVPYTGEMLAYALYEAKP